MKPTGPSIKAPVALVHDPIDELLKADAAALQAPYLDDNGFTLAVMDRLPRHRRLSPWVRNGIPVASASLAAVFAFVFAGADNFLIDASMDVATATATPAALAFCALAAMLAGTALHLARAR
ncbi:MAG: hypothetical protein JNK75_07755 [Betaproteobacteria bacterium]|nr:hypothetical protein [Betaproteobacteria bacterium]